MRYQEPIYVQNENGAVRNKDILNVNMSSDMCIFVAPEYTLSGASKIDCSCNCTPDYTLLEGGICQFVDSVSPTTYGTFFTAHTGSTSTGYDQNGASFYKSDLTGNIPYTLYITGLSDSLNVVITPDINVSGVNLWDSNGSTANGRLNNCGIWPNTLADLEWIGFSKCINLSTSGVYSIGIAADNRTRFKINGEMFYEADIFDSSTFNVWRVFEVTLSAGTNVIEMEGYNDGGLASFGAEIYQADIVTLSAMTTTLELDSVTVFTTKDFRYETNGNIPVEFDLGESSGYSCPAGYFLNTCGTAYTCSILVESGCTVSTGEHFIVDTGTTIPLTFNFTGNTNSFTANSATFRYEVYKYNNNSTTFTLPSVYKSEIFEYSGFSGTSAITQNLPFSGLSLDGQYLVKGYYRFNVCTDYLSQLGKAIDTISFRGGNEYGLYNDDLDFYFAAIRAADKPSFLTNGSNTPPANQLYQQVILPKEGQTTFVISNLYTDFFILTLNGLVLAPNLDFSYSGNVISLSGATILGDIMTLSYTTGGGNNLIGDNINITSTIPSGPTDGEGLNLAYYNTGTTKYEIYTSIEPYSNGSIMVMINGITLANSVDFYQSISNPKRIILEGNLMVGDIITIVYFPVTSVVNALSSNNPTVAWQIANAPQLVNGLFTFELSSASTFTSISSSSTQPYVIGQTTYYDNFIASGKIGDKLYYRVKNEKDYVTICGNIISDIAYSDIMPITIQSNSINSY
jgi:hypothetical protein